MITLFTDASFDNRYPEAAAFAVWAKAGDGSETFRYARHFKAPNHPRTSHDAELMAIMVGVILVRQKWPEEPHVHICSDCIGAMKSILHRAYPKAAHLKPMVAHYSKFLQDTPTRITAKHVKAHTVKNRAMGAHAPRSHVNDWCDREAGQLMRARREQLQNGEGSDTV